MVLNLAIALLTLAMSGCVQERPTSPLPLRERVGQKVTLRGRFSLWGKEGPFVLVGKDPVYLIADAPFTWGEPYVSMDNQEVTITGVLRRFEPPRAATTDPRPVQLSPPHFFFKMYGTTIRLARSKQ